MADTPILSVRAFAKLLGVAAPTVSMACKNGRLKACIVKRDPTGRVAGIDPAVGLLEWQKNTDVGKAPPAEQARSEERVRKIAAMGAAPRADAGEGPAADLSVTDAGAELKFWQAATAKAKHLKLVGELVPAADVERKSREAFSACKARLLGVPSRAKQEMPDLTVPQVQKLEALIREACEDLALRAGPSSVPAAPGLVEVAPGEFVAEASFAADDDGSEESADPLGPGLMGPGAEGDGVPVLGGDTSPEEYAEQILTASEEEEFEPPTPGGRPL